MGLIKAALGSVGGVMADQWKEFFYCESLPNDILVSKGLKRTSGRSSNTKGEDNIISNGSVIAVADGQCMIIVDNGKVTELCATPGEFTYDSSTEPSIFSGDLGEGIKNTFINIGKRFTFGGQAASDQRIYYFNTKEIMGNKYGTANPIPFRIEDPQAGIRMTMRIKCFGEYSYKIVDPMLFYTNVCGNIGGDFRREEIDKQLKSELLTALQPAFAKVGAKGIDYTQLPGYTFEIAEALNDVLSASWTERRGIKVFAFGVSSVSANEEDEARLAQLENSAMMSNPMMAAGRLVDAQASAMQTAAANEGGAMTGFMGMGMAQGMGGMNAQNLFAMGQQQQQQQQYQQQQPMQQAPQAQGGWSCSCGNGGNTGNFCNQCGSPKPQQEAGWTCSCGAVNRGKFCNQCGGKKPTGAPLYACDKCGWQPPDPQNPPKFCSNCGDVFDESDVK